MRNLSNSQIYIVHLSGEGLSIRQTIQVKQLRCLGLGPYIYILCVNTAVLYEKIIYFKRFNIFIVIL